MSKLISPSVLSVGTVLVLGCLFIRVEEAIECNDCFSTKENGCLEAGNFAKVMNCSIGCSFFSHGCTDSYDTDLQYYYELKSCFGETSSWIKTKQRAYEAKIPRHCFTNAFTKNENCDLDFCSDTMGSWNK